jgi:hypothetical protein
MKAWGSRGALLACVVAALLSESDFSSAPLTYFVANLSEQRRGMTVFKQVFVHGDEADLIPGDSGGHPLSATVIGPPFLHGSATFQRRPDGDNEWTGSLSVDLPGSGRVALAGTNFSARLCQTPACPQPTS